MDDAVLLETCIAIAVKAHHGQRDKAGNACILHPLRVMASVRANSGSIEQQAAAVLHDAVEDTPVTLESLECDGVPGEVRNLVAALTKRDSESHDAYLERVLSVPGAALIKETDVLDNSSRLAELEDVVVRERLKLKYEHALAVLRSWSSTSAPAAAPPLP